MPARLLMLLTVEHWRIGASLMRVSLGLWGVFFYLLHWRVRHALWGPDGYIPFEKFRDLTATFNLFQFSRSPLYFEVIYHAAILIAVLLLLGFLPRLMVPLHWAMIWSFQERNPLLGDGGDNLMRIVLLFLVLVNTGAYFSMFGKRHADSHAEPRPSATRLARGLDSLRPALAVVHNFGVLFILVQLCLMYMSTGLYKVMGELWQNGTALYYILRVDEFSWPGVAELIYRNPYLVVMGTYGTVLFEIIFAPSLFNRWTRYLMIAAGLFFHVGIAMVMGLVTFGWSMLSVYPLLVTDNEYQSLAAWWRRRFGLKVFYDGWCPMCEQSITRLGRLDLLSLLQFISFREPGVVERYGLDPEKAARRIQTMAASGTIREGIDSMIDIAARSVVLWPAVPLLMLCRLLAGQRAYDAIASRRLILIPGACEGHCIVEERPAIDSRGSAMR